MLFGANCNSMKRKVIVFTLLLFIALLSIALFDGFPIVLQDHQDADQNDSSLYSLDNDEYNPIRNKNIKEIILVFSLDDIQQLPKGVTKRRVLICDEPNLIEQFKNHFTFEITGGDMATVESQIIIRTTENDIYRTNIVIDDTNIGIQSCSVGWAKAKNAKVLYDIFRQFKTYHLPILNIKAHHGNNREM